MEKTKEDRYERKKHKADQGNLILDSHSNFVDSS